MKVLIINHTDIKGGAARSANRLHKGLQEIGVDSYMLVQDKYSNDPTVFKLKKKHGAIYTKVRSNIDLFPIKFYPHYNGRIFSSNWLPFSGVFQKINEINPDVVHLHWVGSGTLRIEELSKIKQPIVWSLLDMWAFTGGCHYDENCNKHISKCRSCPMVGSKETYDLSTFNFNRKQKTYSMLNNLTVVGHSKWLTECAKKSFLFTDKKVINLPSPIDTESFEPIDKNVAKGLLHIEGKKLIAYGAMSALDDPRKGYEQLNEAFKQISSDAEFLVFGAESNGQNKNNKMRIHFMGNVSDNLSLRIIYSAADVVIVPSIQENLSNVILEALSCGTPVVAFNIGGNPDMIDHKKNGYLANENDISDLAGGIDWVLNYKDYEKLQLNARQKVEVYFELKKVARQYLELYHSII